MTFFCLGVLVLATARICASAVGEGGDITKDGWPSLARLPGASDSDDAVLSEFDLVDLRLDWSFQVRNGAIWIVSEMAVSRRWHDLHRAKK